MAVAAVASALGVGLRSVYRWLQWYREGGRAQVCGRRKGGPGKPSFLTREQERQVVAAAAQGMFATAEAVRDWIEAQFGVVYTVGSMYTRRPRPGHLAPDPRPRQAKADPQVQATWPKGGSANAWPPSV